VEGKNEVEKWEEYWWEEKQRNKELEKKLEELMNAVGKGCGHFQNGDGRPIGGWVSGRVEEDSRRVTIFFGITTLS